MTIKPLVNYLHVAKDSGNKPSANVLIHSKAVDHIIAGIEEIIGQIGDQVSSSTVFLLMPVLRYSNLKHLSECGPCMCS